MSVRAKNEYFAVAFTKELDRWKKEKHCSQEEFAARVEVDPNMITRYKKGIAHPTELTLERICAELGVEKSIFYPSTVEDRFKYDNEFREVMYRGLDLLRYDALREVGIDPAFWGFLWRLVPYSEILFPLFPHDATEKPIFWENTEGYLNAVYQKDLEYVLKLQSDVTEYMTLHLLKSSLRQRFNQADMRGCSEEEINRELEKIYSALTLEILRDKQKEER